MSIASLTASSRLASMVGPAHVISESPELTDYEINGQRPAAVVRPGSAAEIAEIVRFAVAEKLAIVPTGARTKLAMGLPPRQYDLALDLIRLDRVVAYDPGDLTLAVEPGIPLNRLAGVLAEHRQWLPLAVPYLDQSTVGGAIASGVDTSLRQMYGTARDYVLGMEFVTGEGVAAKSGGRVVKNVTGYDMHKLMIGALGTLGVITKINFRTFPVPTLTRACTASFEAPGGALELRHRLSRSALGPMALEVLSPQAAGLLTSSTAGAIVPQPLPAGLLSGRGWAVVAEFSGSVKVLDRCGTDFCQLARECGCVSCERFSGDLLAGITGRIREFIPIALASSPAATVVKMSVLPTRLNEVFAAAAKAAETNAVPWAALARGLGVIYCALLPADRGEESYRRIVQASDEILSACAKLGGHASIPWSPAPWKAALKVWGPARPEFDQMRKLKNIFDPGAVLSPGRFVGGL